MSKDDEQIYGWRITKLNRFKADEDETILNGDRCSLEFMLKEFEKTWPDKVKVLATPIKSEGKQTVKYLGVCLCGWKGKLMDTYDEAFDEADTHFYVDGTDKEGMPIGSHNFSVLRGNF